MVTGAQLGVLLRHEPQVDAFATGLYRVFQRLPALQHPWPNQIARLTFTKEIETIWQTRERVKEMRDEYTAL